MSLHHLLTTVRMPGTVLSSSSPPVIISPQTIPKWILSWFSLVCSCLLQTFVFYLLSKLALAAFPSLACSNHFINMLFTSACRSLATILNNWQFAQKAAVSGVDVSLPSLKEQEKWQRGLDMERPKPYSKMREVACSPFLVNLPHYFALRSSPPGHAFDTFM